MQTIKCVNIEANMPTVEVAEKLILFEINTAKRQNIKVLKIIHGYGSSGTGGRIRTAAKKLLEQKKNAGLIKMFVSGEDWNIFNQTTRSILEACNDARKDKDLGNCNQGISIVLI